MSENKNLNTESEETEDPYQPMSFAKVLGGIFIAIGALSFVVMIIVYNDLSYYEKEEVKFTYWSMAGGMLLGNLAIGSILITLDRIAEALEKDNK